MTEQPPFPELEQPPDARAERETVSRPAEGRGPLLVLSYLWLFCLVPLALEQEDAEVRWHSRHGAILAAAELVAYLLWGFAYLLVGIAVPQAIPHFLLTGPWAVLLVVWAHVVLAWEAVHGRRLRVPGLSQWADRPKRTRG